MLVYFIVDTVRTIVVPPKYSLLLFPATSDVTDGSQDYFTEGLTEELLGDLSTVPELRLLPRRRHCTFLIPACTRRGTRRSLSVNHFMTWNVRRLNDGIILAVSLFDTVQSTPVWKSEFRTSLRELPSSAKRLHAVFSRRSVWSSRANRRRGTGRPPPPFRRPRTLLSGRATSSGMPPKDFSIRPSPSSCSREVLIPPTRGFTADLHGPCARV